MFTFQFLNDKIHNYVKKKLCLNTLPSNIYKLSKTNIFFSRFEGTRGEKTQIFRTLVRKEEMWFLLQHMIAGLLILAHLLQSIQLNLVSGNYSIELNFF